MNLLLDTHALLWALGDSKQLSETARDALLDPANSIAVSAASAWELAIKQGIGKIDLPGAVEDWLPDAVAQAGFSNIPVTFEDALAVAALPWHHRDPFDRLLVAQCRGGRVLVTRDSALAAYGIPLLAC